MHFRKTWVLFALFVTLAASSASATTFNFASLQGNSSDASLPGALTAGSSFTQQGFSIVSAGGSFDVWQFGNPNFPGSSPASTSLFGFSFNTETLITYNGGQPFSLVSIDFAPLLSGGSASFSLVVIAQLADESFIPVTVWINNSPFGLQTVAFPTFTDVLDVHFLQGTNSGYFTGQETGVQFNNIVVTAGNAVPEPGTLLLLGSAFLSAAGFLRQKLGR